MRILALVLAAASLPTVAARAEEPTIVQALRCDGGAGATMAMENEYITGTNYGGCWFHTGHHTYDLDALRAIGSITGRLFSVEIQFSPPSELDADSLIPITLEASADGRTWSTIDTFPYGLLSTRQEIAFTADGGGMHARYLRLRQPRSLAQGLSGYLDSSSMDVEVAPPFTDAVEQGRTGTYALSCATDIMEAMHPAHPCWFGGINRYDSPSVFHTYPLDGPVTLTAIDGSATFLPWRTDDYTGNGGSRTALKGHLFASLDGEHWTNLATFDAQYGLPAPVVWTGSIEAAYVRFVAEYHRGVRSHPALKHVRGMLLDSNLTVTAA